MKKHVLSLFTVLLIAPAISFAQCSGTLMANIISSGSTCYGTPVVITLSGVGSTGWNFAIYKDSLVAGGKISNATFVQDTLNTLPNTVYYATADSAGCPEKTDSISIRVAPVPVVNTVPDVTVCLGDSVQLQCGGGGPGNSYEWTPTTSLNNTNLCSPIAYPIGPVTYTLTVTNANGCTATGTTTISIYPLPPTPTITCSNDTLFCSSDSAYTSFQWYDGASYIPGANWDYLVINHSGNYFVEVADSNGCILAASLSGGCYTGYEDFHNSYILSFSPNPAMSEVFIHNSLLNTNQDVTVSVINVLGEKVQKERIKWRNDTSINIKTLPSGIYFLQVTDESHQWTGRFVKE